MQPVDVLRALALRQLAFGPGDLGVDRPTDGGLGCHVLEFGGAPREPSPEYHPRPWRALPSTSSARCLSSKAWTNSELTRLADHFQERAHAEGETIVEEGASGTSFFVIGEGNANVSVGGETKATLGPGDYFGEMAAVDEGVRSASVVAATDVHSYFLTPWEFRPFVEEHPEIAWKLLQNLARRLRHAQASGAS